MGLYATFNVNTPQAKQQSVLRQLAGEYKDGKRASPKLPPKITIYGYLNAESNDDLEAQATERIHMEDVVIASTSRYLTERGVSPDDVYSGLYPSPVKGHHHTIDIFFQVGEADSSPYRRWDMNTDPAHRQPQKKKPQSEREKEISISSEKEVEVEVQIYKLNGGIRQEGPPEITFKGSVGVKAGKGVPGSAQLFAEREWKPSLENLLKSQGGGSVADKLEFALKIQVGASLTKDEYQSFAFAIAAKINLALSIKIRGNIKFEISAYESVDGNKSERAVVFKIIIPF